MNSKKSVFLLIFIVLTLAVSYAQEPADAQIGPVLVTSVSPENKNDVGWIWGSVINLDNQNKRFSVKYFDYEADQEKEIVLSVDENTAFENFKSLDELKIEDTLSVDYLVGLDNKNIAKNISLEKPDIVSVQEPKAQAPARLEPVVETLPPVAQPETPAVSEATVPTATQPESTVQQQSQVQ